MIEPEQLELFMSQMGLLLTRAHDVERYLAIKPTLMVAPGFLPEMFDLGTVTLCGYEVIRGDRFGVVVPC